MTAFRDAYDDYRLALPLRLTVAGRDVEDADEVVNAYEGVFDAAWHEASTALPPLTDLGHVALVPRNLFFLLDAVARQGVWAEESDEVADDRLALVTTPVEGFMVG